MELTKEQLEARNERMAFMYAQGMTLQKIADEHGITRARVHQVIRRLGVLAEDGGQQMVRALKRSEVKNQKNADALAKYGVPYDEYKKLRSAGVIRAYKMQKKNAEARAIDFKLSFLEWWTIWKNSGKFDQRGRTKNAYVMSRIKDTGGYEVGNVCIKTLQENSKEAVKKWLGKEKKLPRGVFENYPGLPRPFLAKVGRVSLGLFATAQLAHEARMQFKAAMAGQ